MSGKYTLHDKAIRNKARSITFPGLKLYYKAIVTKQYGIGIGIKIQAHRLMEQNREPNYKLMNI